MEGKDAYRPQRTGLGIIDRWDRMLVSGREWQGNIAIGLIGVVALAAAVLETAGNVLESTRNHLVGNQEGQ